MIHSKLVCYRGFNDSQTPISNQLIKSKTSEAALYLASLVINNTPKQSSYLVNKNNMSQLEIDNNTGIPLTCYAELFNIKRKSISIYASLFAGINEQFVGSSTINIKCKEEKILTFNTATPDQIKVVNNELKNIFEKYDTLNINYVFKKYLSSCNLDEALQTKENLSHFELIAAQNFIRFVNSYDEQFINDTNPTLSIKQNLLLNYGNDFLAETFCLNK